MKRADPPVKPLPFADGNAKMAKPGLYANIHAKRKRIAEGSGEKMRSPGDPKAPKKSDFVKSAKTAKRNTKNKLKIA